MDESAVFRHRQQVFFIAGVIAIIRIVSVFIFFFDDTRVDQINNPPSDTYSGFLVNMKELVKQGTEAMLINCVALIMELFSFVLGYFADINKIDDQVASLINLLIVCFNIGVHICGVMFVVDQRAGIIDSLTLIRSRPVGNISAGWMGTAALNAYMFLALFVGGSVILLLLFKSSLKWYGVSMDLNRTRRVERTVVRRPLMRTHNQILKNEPKDSCSREFHETMRFLNASNELFREIRAKLEIAEDNDELITLEEVENIKKMIAELKAQAVDKKDDEVTAESDTVLIDSDENIEEGIEMNTMKMEVMQATVMTCIKDFEQLLYALSVASGDDYENICKKFNVHVDEEINVESKQEPRNEMMKNEEE